MHREKFNQMLLFSGAHRECVTIICICMFIILLIRNQTTDNDNNIKKSIKNRTNGKSREKPKIPPFPEGYWQRDKETVQLLEYTSISAHFTVLQYVLWMKIFVYNMVCKMFIKFFPFFNCTTSFWPFLAITVRRLSVFISKRSMINLKAHLYSLIFNIY